MYNGYIEQAKISATKENHTRIVAFVSSTLVKCSLNPNGVMRSGNHQLKCKDLVVASTATQKFVYWAGIYGFKNPYNGYGCCGHATHRMPYLGETYLAAVSTKKIIVRTRAESGQPGLQTSIQIE